MAGKICLPASTFTKGCIVFLIIKSVCTYPHREFELRKLTTATIVSSSSSPPLSITKGTEDQQRVVSSSTEVVDNKNQDLAVSNKFPKVIDPIVVVTKKRKVRSSNTPKYEKESNGSTGSLVDSFKTQRSYDQQQGFLSTVSTGGRSDVSKIVFPTEDPLVGQTNKFSFGPVPVCEGTTFCERPPYYPEDAVNAAIQRNHSITFLASVDMVPPQDDLAQRIDVLNDDTPLCLSTEQLIYPKTAENNKKEWLFVVNQENFKQGVRIETCRNENSDCSVIDGLAAGYKTSCKQKYVYRQLAAVSESGIINPEMFRFPSSCCCHAKLTGNPLVRMGVTIRSERVQTTISNKGRQRK